MVKQSDILKQYIMESDVLNACKRWNNMPDPTNDRVYTESPEKTLCGFISEEAIARLMPLLVRSIAEPDVYHYDFKYFDAKMEIKNKCVNSFPTPEYDVSINQYWIPNCDFFLFTRMISVNQEPIFPRSFKMTSTITEDMMKTLCKRIVEKYPCFYLLGYISKNSYLQGAILVNRGDLLPYGQRAKGNTINRFIKELNPVKALLDFHEKKKISID